MTPLLWLVRYMLMPAVGFLFTPHGHTRWYDDDVPSADNDNFIQVYE